MYIVARIKKAKRLFRRKNQNTAAYQKPALLSMLHHVCFLLTLVAKFYLRRIVHERLVHGRFVRVLPENVQVSHLAVDSLFLVLSIYVDSTAVWFAHYYDMFFVSFDVRTSCVLVTLALTWGTKLSPAGTILATLQSLVNFPQKTSELVRSLEIPIVGIMYTASLFIKIVELSALAYYGVYAMYSFCSFMILDTAVSNEKLSYFVYFFSSVCLLKNVYCLCARISAMVP